MQETPGDAPETGTDLERDPATGQFLPGHKGLGGRPPGSVNLTARVQKRLRERLVEMRAQGEGPAAQQRAVDAVVDTWVDKMIEGSPPHLTAFLDRDEGKPVERQLHAHVPVARALTLIGMDGEPEIPAELDEGPAGVSHA